MGVGAVITADAMAAISRARGAEFAAMPTASAATLVRKAVEIVTKTLEKFGVARAELHVLGTLRHLLACPALRKVAAKASRLRSLAVSALASLPRDPDRRVGYTPVPA
jgi:hypothetical protein